MIEDEAVRHWLGRLKSSRRCASRTLRLFCDEVLSGESTFAGLSPSQLVEWQSMARGRDSYHIKRLAQEWIESLHLRVKTKQLRMSYINSFFMHNYAPLPSDPTFHFTSTMVPVEGKLDFDGFRKILLNSNKMYRAILLMMFQACMGVGELVYVNTHYPREILQYLTNNEGIFKLSLPGRKRSRNVTSFYTMLSTKSDWGEAMREYLKSVSALPTTALITNQYGNPITGHNILGYFTAHAVKVGILKKFSPPCSSCRGETVRFRDYKIKSKTGYKCKECGKVDWANGRKWECIRYGVNPHEMRDLMKSRWHVSGADISVWEFMAQHEVDPNLYDKFMKLEPWYPLQEYKKALVWLNVLSSEPDKVSKSEIDSRIEERDAEVEVLRREVSRLSREVDSGREALELLSDPEVLGALKNIKKKQ